MKKDIITICFDYSHNNKLIIESSSYNDFVAYLFGSGFKIGQIKQGITKEKLAKYDMFFIGNPYNSKFEIEEIDAIEQYVKEGGGLLLISDDGGDYQNETNLCELSTRFGFSFNPDKISDSMSYVNQQDKPIIKNFEPHYITKNVEQIVHSSGCSIDVDESIEADENISIHTLAKTGLNAFKTTWNGEEYEEEDAPRVPILTAVNYYEGRVIGFGNVSIFSSLSSFYGFNTLDNNVLISNIINWLSLAGIDEDSAGLENKVLSLPINQSLYLWMEKLVQENKWDRVKDIVNFSVKYLKDHYNDIMEETKERREKLKKQREEMKKKQEEAMKLRDEERKSAMDSLEDDILNLGNGHDERSESEARKFDDLMSELSKLSDEDE